jgi:hypothetical protein
MTEIQNSTIFYQVASVLVSKLPSILASYLPGFSFSGKLCHPWEIIAP